jgi:ectoine hydroxylase-related dioxygenase (phytanoyl-CoA dioxygenase family)
VSRSSEFSAGKARIMTAPTMSVSSPPAPGWFTPADCRLEDFRPLVEQAIRLDDYPHADAVEQNVLIYGERLRGLAAADGGAGTAGKRREVQAELARALLQGPGIVVFKRAFAADVVDRATEVFTELIEEQRATGTAGGDHFAKPGANDRIWRALDKFALRAPQQFANYYANDVLALICEAWLGPHYQVTSQVNVVNPGGQAQVVHRDYHLGFMDREQALAYPAHAHLLSPTLTLQGAVAHCGMPAESGPTMYLPHSQKYPPGYVAFHQPEFVEYFGAHYVQLPLEKGDAAFFNPALFHGAGTNRSADIKRMANLLQVSSAFGRAMESVDTTAICAAVFPALKARAAGGPGGTGGTGERAVRNLIAVAAEGYPFPTNLDRDQPIGGLVPQSQAQLLSQALEQDWDVSRLRAELAAQQERTRA